MLNPKTSGNLAVFAGALLLAILSMKVYAGDLVSARYIASKGKKIVMEIKIQPPPPNTIIVIQHLPAGTDIKRSLPPLDKYDPKHGEAKWLLKKVKPGTFRISMETAGTVRSGEVRGEIRYRDPSTGTMSKIYVSP